MKKRSKRRHPKLKMKPETTQAIVGVGLITFGLLILISFSGQGTALIAINKFLVEKLGASLLLLPFLLIAAGLSLFRTKFRWTQPHVLLGSLILFIGFVLLFRTGTIGLNSFESTSRLISKAGTIIASISLLLIGILVMTQLKVQEMIDVFGLLKRKPTNSTEKDTADEKQPGRFHLPSVHLPALPFRSKEKTPDERFVDDDSAKKTTKPPLLEPLITPPPKETPPTESLPKSTNIAPSTTIWHLPPIDLLEEAKGVKANRGDVSKNADTIEQTLESFGIRAEVKEVNRGPAVTQYALEISRGTKLSKITGLSTDLALALAAPTGQIRIEAPIAGRSLVGIEVPNYSAEFVNLRDMLEKPIMKKQANKKLLVALGTDVTNQPVAVDINAMPHILIAGATGSGKSVALNSFLCSILFRATPQEVRLILVDPKRVELTWYKEIPHLLTPVIVESKQVVASLNWAVHEMENRYKLLHEVGVREIAGYNEVAGHSAMYHIVIVIDELADVMMYAPAEVEEAVTRIAQMARAVGIHLVLATQRPSVDVLTGLIKANIPARIAFNVSSMTDSRVILDTPGAEKLLGKGDMLFISPDRAKPIRVQGTYVSDKEIKRLTQYLRDQDFEPQYLEEVTSKYKVMPGKSGVLDTNGDEKDELFLEVCKILITQDKASSSSIQRRFSIGYNRAARILDQLYAAGMIGPSDGSKPRGINATRIMEYIHHEEGTNGSSSENDE